VKTSLISQMPSRPFVVLLVCAAGSVSGFRTLPVHRIPSVLPRAAVPVLDAAAAAPTPASSMPPLPATPNPNIVMRSLTAVYFAFACFGSALIVYPPLICITLVSLVIDNTRRRWNDWVVAAWGRLTMTFMRGSVTVEGTENLPPHGEAVMFVPNHCSFLDIFALSGYLPRRFKYISKIEILRIPLIGWAMQFANHIAIRRTDRASQLATLKEAIACLQAGSSLVTFAEGTRSKDGRIMDFKKGPFTMASRAQVRIVPISIIGTHIFFPASALAPSTSPRGLRIVVHPPIDAPADKTQEQAAVDECKKAIMSVLPPEMLPLPKA